jgi:hypothetical protein
MAATQGTQTGCYGCGTVAMERPSQIVSPADGKQYFICCHCARLVNTTALSAGKAPVTTALPVVVTA